MRSSPGTPKTSVGTESLLIQSNSMGVNITVFGREIPSCFPLKMSNFFAYRAFTVQCIYLYYCVFCLHVIYISVYTGTDLARVKDIPGALAWAKSMLCLHDVLLHQLCTLTVKTLPCVLVCFPTFSFVDVDT